LACGPHVGMRAPVGLGQRGRSPGGIRLEVRDDRWDPTVSLSGVGGSGKMGRRRKWAVRPTGPLDCGGLQQLACAG
jgi:hypothetical protein